MNGMFLQGLFKGGAAFKVRHYFQDVKELYRFLFSLHMCPVKIWTSYYKV